MFIIAISRAQDHLLFDWPSTTKTNLCFLARKDRKSMHNTDFTGEA